MNTPQDTRQYAPATQRNREPILEVLMQVLPATGSVLEVASGTGEHAVYFAPRLFPRQWIPSDPNPLNCASITAWRKHLSCETLHPPLEIDTRQPVWIVEKEIPFNPSPITAIVNINMIHISPWDACLGLMAGAGRILSSGGILYLYGSFKRDGKHTAPSNAAFDEYLRVQNPEWGIRNLEDVVIAASKHNLSLVNVYQMPANNFSVVFKVNYG
ncbi:DUF938 domain-containing protein [Fischerella sp. JS2]|uniref:DUF938 domain-containing protein n=1 Tax=Fischerella sp. JS2 TaxID=2597771 RepID=UPI0028E4506A|nr:DUF938 domain-containing protein [Fischerella sp. JS2]